MIKKIGYLNPKIFKLMFLLVIVAGLSKEEYNNFAQET